MGLPEIKFTKENNKVIFAAILAKANMRAAKAALMEFEQSLREVIDIVGTENKATLADFEIYAAARRKELAENVIAMVNIKDGMTIAFSQLIAKLSSGSLYCAYYDNKKGPK